jgi:hypothetical protein
MALMIRTDSLARGSRWPIIPKWEDRQVYLITLGSTRLQLYARATFDIPPARE